VSRNEASSGYRLGQDRLERTADTSRCDVEWARSVVFERRPEHWAAASVALTGAAVRGGTRFGDFAPPACALDRSSVRVADTLKVSRKHVVTDEDDVPTAWQRVTQGAEHRAAMSSAPIARRRSDGLHDVATTADRQIFDGGIRRQSCDVPGYCV